MTQVLLKGGRVIDPSQNIDEQADLLIRDGKIAAVGKITTNSGIDHIENVEGKIVVPGLIDMHVHLREPGFEYKEDIESGSKAAAAGGVTGIACMPNTNPVTDNRATVDFIVNRSIEVGYAKVYPIGALSKGMSGAEISEIADMIAGGAVAFSDDAFPITNAGFMRRAMEYCSMFDVPVITHCEDVSLSDDGLMNEGIISTKLGLKGIPHESEEVSVLRNIMISQITGCRLHVAHVSTKGSVDIIRRAKQLGINITCETCPQYFSLTEEAVDGYNTNAKMNPPLRIEEDRAAIISGLMDGTIDVIATDHAPHAVEEKETDFASAANGIVGLETCLPLSITLLVKENTMSLNRLIALMSTNPAKALGIKAGTLALGAAADVTVIDMDAEITVDPSKFKSRSRNTPFAGMRLYGAAAMTVLDGRIIARYGELV